MAKVCEQSVRGTLLNPETAEFHDFQSITASEYAEQEAAGTMLSKRGTIPPDVYEARERAIREMTQQNLSKDEARFDLFSLRVRSEGKQGNKITWKALCMAQGNSCVCVDPELKGDRS